MSNDVLLLSNPDIMHLVQIHGLVIVVVLTVKLMFLNQLGFSGYKDKNEKKDKLPNWHSHIVCVIHSWPAISFITSTHNLTL